MENGRTYKFKRQTEKVARYIRGVLDGAFCTPEQHMKAVRLAIGTDVHGGFHLTEMYRNTTPLRTKYRANTKEFAGLGLLGQGQDGTVYIGYYGSVENHPIAIKIWNHCVWIH